MFKIYIIKESMTSFKKTDQVNFELTSTITWGVKKDKYSGYSIPVVLNDEISEKIEELARAYDTNNPLYDKTLYLKSKNLSSKQKSDLYNKGKTFIEIHFMVKGVYTKNDVNYLTFRVIKLRKTEDASESDDSCPED